MADTVSQIAVPYAVIRLLTNPLTRKAAIKSGLTMFSKFFVLQYKGALFGKIPVYSVDHPLDEKIPFTPSMVNIYLDFVAFWIRTAAFILLNGGESGAVDAARFIADMGRLYAEAATVYSNKLSTTRRPRYLKKPRFVLIHMFDPHLMCIPSLHVMVVIRTYTHFREIIDSSNYRAQITEIRNGAIAITESVLFIKQHSVNCIAAAMYMMSRFAEQDGRATLFTEEEARLFVNDLFAGTVLISEADVRSVREHIFTLYQKFLREGANASVIASPLLDFLETMPRNN